MKKVKTALVLAAPSLLFAGLAFSVFAQPPPPQTFPPQNDIDINSVSNVVPSFTVAQAVTFIVRLLIIIAFIISFIFLLIGGVRWIASGGDAKAVEGARNMVTAALVGLVIVLAAFALIRLIEFFFRITIISAPLTVPQI